jgi:anti-sigma regulatory factor (Ser/Thr protein kinase)
VARVRGRSPVPSAPLGRYPYAAPADRPGRAPFVQHGRDHVTSGGTASGTWPAESSCVPAVRRFVRDYLRRQAQSDLIDDAELLVSELVGNVVLHVGGDVSVRAHAVDGELLLEVSDSSPVPPVLRGFSASASTGRGLRLVHSLAAEHGVLPNEDGKTIWARITRGTSSRSDAELAEAFVDVDWLAEIDELRGDPPGATVSSLPQRAAVRRRWAA